MKEILLATLVVISLSGCAGVSIAPISAARAQQAHQDASGMRGYIVYEPVVLVELSEKVICLDQKKDECAKAEITCSVGAPFVLPNYSKPYIVDVRSGFGKAGVELTFKDGWLLTNVKDSSDNTALLNLVEKIGGLDVKGKGIAKVADGRRTCQAGLYQIISSESGIRLQLVRAYVK